MSTNWTEQQQAVIANRGGTLLVSAAAGSGKTAVLVERVLRRITDPENPCDIDSFLIVTYTRAAASEMRGKIADALRALAAERPEEPHLRRQLMLVHRAQITTVHAYCMALLKEHYNEAGLPPEFGMADESRMAAIRDEVLEDVLEACYAEENEGFALLAEVMGTGRDDRRLREVLQETFDTMQCSPDPRRALEQYRDDYVKPFERFGDTLWGRQLLRQAEEMTEYGIGILKHALAEMSGLDDVLEKYEPAFQDDIDTADRLLSLLEQGDWDEAVRFVGTISPVRLKSVRGYPDPDFLKYLKDRRDEWKNIVKALKADVLFLTEAEIREDLARMAPAVSALCDTVLRFSGALAEEKLRRSILDFSDLEHYALKLLIHEDGTPTDFAKEIHFTEIMVDEYQDTNAVQDAIFRAVSDEESNIFMVGDVKQSIYRFRRANPGIFLRRYHEYRDADQVTDGAPRRIVLSKNFRSRPEVLESVNTLFREVMSEKLGDLDYTDRESLHPGASYPDSPEDYRTELYLLDTGADAEEGSGEEETPETVRLEADFCAQKIRELLDTGFRVTDKETGALRPCRPDDIVILMRSVSSRLAEYQDALLQYGILGCGDTEDEILEAPEILTALSLLEILDNPHQDVPLLAVLRSHLFRFSEEELAEIRLERRGCDFYTALKAAAETREDVREFCGKLALWRLMAADKTVYELLWFLLKETGAMEVYGALPGGQNRQRNLVFLLEEADRFEQNGVRGLFAFVRAMRALREQDKGMNVTGRGDRSGAVRIMTIHKSKGLEFPIVILANSAKKFNEKELTGPVLLHEELGIAMKCRDTEKGLEYSGVDRAAVKARIREENISEELRVLYVAMTRAKEKLIITAAFKRFDTELKKWAAAASVRPVPVHSLMQAKQYSTWLGITLLRHPCAELLRAQCAVAPPVTLPEDHSWAVHVVPYTSLGSPLKEEPAGFADLADRAGSVTLPELKPYPAEALANLPSKLTATALAAGYKAEEAAEGAGAPRGKARPLRRPCFAREERRLSPAEVGTAHHLFLQFCDFARCETAEGRQEELERLRGRHILSREQAEAVSPELIGKFFDSDIAAEIRNASDVRREFKFSVLVPAADYLPEAAGLPEEEVLLQGVVDCMFTAPEGIVIVDFKTDRVTPGTEAARAERYRPQLEVYRRAVKEVFGKAAARSVLYFLRTGACVEV